MRNPGFPRGLGGLPASQMPQIGFDWLCFPALAEGQYLHNPFHIRSLRQIDHFEIGFVFSDPSTESTLSVAERAQDIRAWPG